MQLNPQAQAPIAPNLRVRSKLAHPHSRRFVLRRRAFLETGPNFFGLGPDAEGRAYSVTPSVWKIRFQIAVTDSGQCIATLQDFPRAIGWFWSHTFRWRGEGGLEGHFDSVVAILLGKANSRVRMDGVVSIELPWPAATTKHETFKFWIKKS